MREVDPAAAAALRVFTRNLRRGQDAAWSEFHREYGPAIFRQLIALAGGDQHLANDALQQTYLRVARYVRPTTSAGQFNAWLRRVACSAIADCRRTQHRFWSLLHRRALDSSLDDRGEKYESEMVAALDNALRTLRDEERALLEAKYFTGLSVEEIASTLSISPKAAESRLTRARAALRCEIERLLKGL